MKPASKKINLKQYIWNGFNYIFGTAFINYFAGVINDDGNVKGLGLNQLWVYAFASFVAYVCVLSFKKMSSLKKEEFSNGGAANYVGYTYRKFWGLFIGFIQFIFILLMVTFGINMIFKNIFSPSAAEYDISGDFVIPDNIIYLGAYTNLFLDIIGITIVSLCICITIFGIKHFKNSTKWTGVFKWIAASLLIILAIYMAFKNGTSNMQVWSKKSNLSMQGFTNGFNTSFYALCGFEMLVTTGNKMQNPDKNIGKGISLSLILAISTTLTLLTIFFCGFSVFSSNMNIFSWKYSNLPKWVEITGIVFTSISIIIMYANGAIQNGLYSSSILEPLSQSGFFSKKLIKQNKNNTSTNSVLFMIFLLLITASILLLIPDIIEGAKLSHDIKIANDRTSKIEIIHNYEGPFSISSLSQLTSVFSLIIYISVILCCFKNNKCKRIILKLYEKALFIIALIILCTMFVAHYGFEIYDVFTCEGNMLIIDIIKITFELFILLTSISFFLIRYKILFKHYSL